METVSGNGNSSREDRLIKKPGSVRGSAAATTKPRRRRIRSELDRLLSDEGTRNMLRGLKKPNKAKQSVTGGLFRKRVLVGGRSERGKIEVGKRGGRVFRSVRGRGVVRRGGAGGQGVGRGGGSGGSTRGRSRSGSPGKGNKVEAKGGEEDVKIDLRFINVSKRSGVGWVTVVGSVGEVKEEREEEGNGGGKKLDGGFGVKILQSIEVAFRVLEQDNSISVIVLQNSHSRYFCNGIELSELVTSPSFSSGGSTPVSNGVVKNSSNSSSSNQASVMIKAMKSLITTLNSSRKLLVASITGDCVGLGVMLLPLFDFVYANDKSMFKVHYNALGQSPEGVGLFSGLLRGGGAGKLTNLIYLNTPLTATEAQSSGLVTEILWPARYQEELATRIHSMSLNSSLMMKSKLIVRNLKRPVRLTDLWGEFTIIEGQWATSEFQSRAKAYLSCGGVLDGCKVLNGG